ncbi:hypothetical protein [Tichowtungia aerotolerans]|uniref:Uncharacterized protein n=1 Tax=Tichowtungia aerotolerans TaxID=2697043 RepID=A0A6P1M3H0_9BACT|nr:hypothetical protein [Tichowtungia aerotolerans]QHI68397.1 hypothetical protein GT409_02635 [Tichowtungia aerotolerans]
MKQYILWFWTFVFALGLEAAENSGFDFGKDPMRYLENDRLKIGINLSAGGAVTYLEDKACDSGNMINSFDWGRQIQQSYYSGPIPFIGPNGEEPVKNWAGLGWNPIQAGSAGGIPSKVIAFKKGKNFMRVRCIPMQWPHINLPGDCEFEATYRLHENNVVLMESRIINARSDHTQYPARNQEMPALYTNGEWYRLVTYLGDAPFTGAPVTTVVGKDDGKGWPWSKFYAPEHWTALLNEENFGVGLYQPDTARMLGGFAGGGSRKGFGGMKDVQTGYIAPVADRVLDHNIDWTYRTYIIVGSLDEIRGFAQKQPRTSLVWTFDDSRQGWSYRHASDSGWPVRDGLNISFKKKPRGLMISDEIFWQAEAAAVLELEAAFGGSTNAAVFYAEAVVQPFGPEDTIDFLLWVESDVKDAVEKKQEQFPPAKPAHIPFQVTADGEMRTYRVSLADNPEYKGAMKQLRIVFPVVDGTVRVRRISLK